jgi:hypothetical protein
MVSLSSCCVARISAEVGHEARPIFSFNTLQHLKTISFKICRGESWPALLETLITTSDTQVITDINIFALEVEHSEWTNHVWSAALARLDQHLKLAALTDLKRLSINISFKKIWGVRGPAHIPPPMPIARERRILHFTFNSEYCSYREYSMTRCKIA